MYYVIQLVFKNFPPQMLAKIEPHSLKLQNEKGRYAQPTIDSPLTAHNAKITYNRDSSFTPPESQNLPRRCTQIPIFLIKEFLYSGGKN